MATVKPSESTVGAYYRINHTRKKGLAFGVVTSAYSKEWASLRLTKGSLAGINDYYGVGDTVSVRDSLCSLIECDKETATATEEGS